MGRVTAEKEVPRTSITVWDHYPDQCHESVSAFFGAWEVRERGGLWNEMNVPVGLAIYEDDNGQWIADILVLLPRKAHVKHLYIKIRTSEEVKWLRASFVNIGILYDAAKESLQQFANGGEAWLYYWEPLQGD